MRVQAMVKPSEEDVAETAKDTQAALDRVLQGKLAAVNPTTVPTQPGAAQLIKYTPAQQVLFSPYPIRCFAWNATCIIIHGAWLMIGAAILKAYSRARMCDSPPSLQGPQYASGAGARLIKMQDMPIDPLEPPKFRCCFGFVCGLL
jgi:SNW domain-containing protein 1